VDPPMLSFCEKKRLELITSFQEDSLILKNEEKLRRKTWEYYVSHHKYEQCLFSIYQLFLVEVFP